LAASVAEIETQIKNLTLMYNEALKYAGVTATNNWVSMEDVFVQSLETEYPAEVLDGLRVSRANLDALLQSYGGALGPLLREYGRAIAAPETDPVSILKRRIYDYFVANTKTVTSRGITFGSVTAAGGNIGGATLHRLNTDANGFAIEGTYLDAKVAKCIADQNSGSRRHEELFEFRGAAQSRDSLLPTGSGKRRNIALVSGAQSLLQNPSFSDFAGTTAVPTDIPGWTPLSSIANFAIDQTNYYREMPGESAPASLKISTNDTIYQRINLQGTQLDPLTPYYLQCVYNRQVGSGDGNLTLHLGSQTVVVALVAQTGWNILKIPLGVKNWLKTFNEDYLDVKIQISSRTTGYTLVDEPILVSFTEFDNLWYCPIGSATPHLTDDSFSWSDALAGSDSILQKWFWRFCQGYLPHSSSPSVVDP